MKELEASDDEDAADRIENIDELVSKVVSYEETHEEPNLSEFLEEVALVADIDRAEEGDDRVLLMTLHSAKGLEFPHVYLAGMEDGVFPSYMTIMSDDPMDIEEERRLAYVGITRAKDDLTLTCAKQRMLRGETQYNPVSRFVKEIPPELLDNRLPTQKKPEFDTYADDSVQRSHFLSKPFGIGESGSGGFRRSKTDYAATMEETSFRRSALDPAQTAQSGPKEEGYRRSGQTTAYQSRFGKDADTIFDKPKPKAVVRPKRTASEVQPFLAKATGPSAGLVRASGEQNLGYAAGDRVRHMRYGEGTVLKIEPGPRDAQVTVMFDEAGQKIMYAGFAKLRKI